MARKRKAGVNVSQAIRDYLKENKDTGPKAAAEAITKQIGQTVSPTYVSNIKSTMNGTPKKKQGRRRRKVTRAPAARAASKNGSVDFVTIAAAKELVGRLGADAAKQLIDLLA